MNMKTDKVEVTLPERVKEISVRVLAHDFEFKPSAGGLEVLEVQTAWPFGGEPDGVESEVTVPPEWVGRQVLQYREGEEVRCRRLSSQESVAPGTKWLALPTGQKVQGVLLRESVEEFLSDLRQSLDGERRAALTSLAETVDPIWQGVDYSLRSGAGLYALFAVDLPEDTVERLRAVIQAGRDWVADVRQKVKEYVEQGGQENKNVYLPDVPGVLSSVSGSFFVYRAGQSEDNCLDDLHIPEAEAKLQELAEQVDAFEPVWNNYAQALAAYRTPQHLTEQVAAVEAWLEQNPA